ncbi:MAG: SDR family oxidoreductase [Rhodospirillales bacterium]|nr:SDR family oxidoreductase [Rhodospirillales bacterium]
MNGKTCVITGSTGGIGRVAALRLADAGARVVIVGRDRQRGQALAEGLRRQRGPDTAEFFAADLSAGAARSALADAILQRHPRIDVLVNNAGGMFGRRTMSADGLEMTFALNHMGYFHLTHLLLPAIRAAAPARIVNVASDAHFGASLDFEDLQNEHSYRRLRAYKRSKLANVYFTYELARRLEGSGVTVNALHPGFVATEIGVRNRLIPRLVWSLATLAAIDVEAGARTSVFLASAPEVANVTGRYFDKCRPKPSSPASYDEPAQRRLWDISAGLCGLDPATATAGL